MIRSHVLALAALVTLTCGTVVTAAPTSNVVFGNLGSSGTNSVGSFNADINGTNPALAQGFTASSPKLTLQSVSLWLSGTSTPASVSIYDATALAPPGGPGDPVATSSSQTIGAKGLYQFSFSGVELVNGTNYWIVPNGTVSWFLAGGAPTQQNASGYAYTATQERPFSGFWETTSTTSMSVSITAVPEPSTYALAAIGFGVAGVARWRRRAARSRR